MKQQKMRIGDLVMVNREMITSLTAAALPDVVWMKAGVLCEINRSRVRVHYGETFYAWFDLCAVYKAQGAELVGETAA